MFQGSKTSHQSRECRLEHLSAPPASNHGVTQHLVHSQVSICSHQQLRPPPAGKESHIRPTFYSCHPPAGPWHQGSPCQSQCCLLDHQATKPTNLGHHCLRQRPGCLILICQIRKQKTNSISGNSFSASVCIGPAGQSIAQYHIYTTCSQPQINLTYDRPCLETSGIDTRKERKACAPSHA